MKNNILLDFSKPGLTEFVNHTSLFPGSHAFARLYADYLYFYGVFIAASELPTSGYTFVEIGNAIHALTGGHMLFEPVTPSTSICKDPGGSFSDPIVTFRQQVSFCVAEINGLLPSSGGAVVPVPFNSVISVSAVLKVRS